MGRVEQQEIHITKASGVASALGWWAKYHKIDDEKDQMCRQLACWMLFQTRATKVEVPNTPAIPVVMGMIAQEGQLGLMHAPAIPNWAFQGYITDEEHDEFVDKQTVRMHNKAVDEQRKRTVEAKKDYGH